MEHLIRPCQQKDLPALVGLCRRHADYEQAEYLETGKAEQLGMAIFADSPKLFCYVVEVDEQMAGYFSYTFDYSTWDAQYFLYLDCLYLDPDFRGSGIGAEIFELLTAIAQQNDCVNIQWQTPVFNERAIKFYKRIGGTPKDKVRFFLNTAQKSKQ
jgi:ribosomal protein S18 acetylase RimI-like enzyme